ncbi:MAG: PIN domain-containing protein [Gemmatimonadota bacterium]|nr:MAG: PIN domain-containing protein [Gemmatimonadota bacterium]
MRVAYVDTSCLVAIAFGEPNASVLARKLEGFDELVSSNLLGAELWASFAREEVGPDARLLSWISWVLPDRPLSQEIGQALAVGYLGGPDLWHLACALYLVETPREISFITLDDRQRSVAEGLGFPT